MTLLVLLRFICCAGLLVCLLLLTGCTVPQEYVQDKLATTVAPTPRAGPTSTISPPTDSRQSMVVIAGQTAPIETGRPFSIGTSVDGRPLLTYRFGTGPVFVVLIGGIHGGYEPNTVTLAGQFIDFLADAPQIIPPAISIFVIPAMNPDGFTKSGPPGRVNAHLVDLNRNWECNWIKKISSYYGQPYHSGFSAFSEPETRAVRDFLLDNDFKIAVFYHSRGSVVFFGECGGAGRSFELAQIVSQATGYALVDSTVHPVYGEPIQRIPGEATDYLDGQGLAAIDIELSTREIDNIDWEPNYRGLLAIIDYAAAWSDGEPETIRMAVNRASGQRHSRR